MNRAPGVCEFAYPARPASGLSRSCLQSTTTQSGSSKWSASAAVPTSVRRTVTGGAPDAAAPIPGSKGCRLPSATGSGRSRHPLLPGMGAAASGAPPMTVLRTLVGTAALADHLDDPLWVVVDCRHDLLRPEAGRAGYANSHSPGARFMHLDHDLAGPKTGTNGRHPLPDAASFAAKLGAAGIGAGTQGIAYDAQEGVHASRPGRMLRWV